VLALCARARGGAAAAAAAGGAAKRAVSRVSVIRSEDHWHTSASWRQRVFF